MTDLNYLSGIVACVMLAFVWLGYVRVALSGAETRLVHHFSNFIIFLASAYVLRTIWWDTLRVVLGTGRWEVLRDMTDGATADVAFNTLAIVGGWHGLKALHLMIPDAERGRWAWWSAWGYPPWAAAIAVPICLRRIGRRIFRRDK